MVRSAKAVGGPHTDSHGTPTTFTGICLLDSEQSSGQVGHPAHRAPLKSRYGPAEPPIVFSIVCQNPAWDFTT